MDIRWKLANILMSVCPIVDQQSAHVHHDQMAPLALTGVNHMKTPTSLKLYT